MIRKIEEISMHAWPALQTIHYDGWVVRFASGVTKRSNSVNPIYNSTLNVVDKIKYCEKLYFSKNLPTCFKITEISQPGELDKILESYGYKHEFDISVQLMNINGLNSDIDKNAHITQETNNLWIDHYIKWNEMDLSIKPVMKKIFNKIVLPKCFITYKFQGLPIGCGLGVIKDRFLGVFDIVIDKPYRNQGFGTILIENILKWGKSKGAANAYLQVLANNDQALELYKKVGFRERYKYWYRIKKQKQLLTSGI
jgi:ribosomal protein S18 acetylase RimI-like enzyme